MSGFKPREWHRCVLLFVFALLLAGCGGGSSSSDSGNGTGTGGGGGDDGSTISGTAAAGAPIVGFVGAKDGNDDVVTTEINADGSYELDVAALQPPILLFASGISGGRAYQILSVAFDSDIGDTVNVTPLTDLIVGNTARKNPVDFFNNPTELANFTEETIQAETDRIATRLRSIMDAVGVADDFDLRRSGFSADRTGFDRVLDVVEVKSDSGSNTATIRNRLDNSEISNNYEQPEGDTDQLEASPDFDTRAAAMDNLGQTLKSLADLIDTPVAARSGTFAQDVEVLFAASARIDGLVRNSVVSILSDDDPVEVSDLQQNFVPPLRNWSLISLDLDADSAVVNVGSGQGGWEMTRTSDTAPWVINGNQAEYYIELEPEYFFNQSGQQQAAELYIEVDARDFGDFGPDDYFVLTGPGLPAEGIAFDRDSAEFGEFQFSIVLTSAIQEAIANGAEFDVTRFTDTDGDTVIDQNGGLSNNGDDTLRETLTVLVDRGSPDTISGTPAFSALTGDTETGLLNADWTLPAGFTSATIALDRNPGGRVFDERLATSATSFSKAEVPAPADPQALDWEDLVLFTRDPFGVTLAVVVTSPFAWAADSGGDNGNGDITDAEGVHFMQNFLGVEGQLVDEASIIFTGFINHFDADLDLDAGTLTWQDGCVAEFMASPENINPPLNPDFFFERFCGDFSDQWSGLLASDSGFSVALPARSNDFGTEKEEFGAMNLTFRSLSNSNDFFLATGHQTFSFVDETKPEGQQATDGAVVNAFAIAQKSSNMDTSQLDGDWGFMRQLKETRVNGLEYAVNAVDITIANSELQLHSEYEVNLEQSLTADGTVSITRFDDAAAPVGFAFGLDAMADGTILWSDGGSEEFRGFTNPGGDLMFINGPALAGSVDDNSEFTIQHGVAMRRATTVAQADLDGKEYLVIGQGNWAEDQRLEASTTEPGSTLSFSGNQATINRGDRFFAYNFEGDEQDFGLDMEENRVIDWTALSNGMIRIKESFTEGDDQIEYQIFGFASPDYKVLMLATGVSLDSPDFNAGGVSIEFAICTNCD